MAKQFDGGQSRFDEKRKREERHSKQLPGEDDEALPEPVGPVRVAKTPGRNEPCSCGSGKKYKQCCGKKG